MRYFSQPLTDTIQIRCQLWILVDPVLPDDLSIRFTAKLDLVCIAQEHKLLLTGNRIGCAGKNPEKKSGQTKSSKDDFNVPQNGAPLISEATTSSNFFHYITSSWIYTNKMQA
jgi:hypothetical protein